MSDAATYFVRLTCHAEVKAADNAEALRKGREVVAELEAEGKLKVDGTDAWIMRDEVEQCLER